MDCKYLGIATFPWDYARTGGTDHRLPEGAEQQMFGAYAPEDRLRS
ncbi:hypothetical protein [Nocardioides bigeumensis]|uniref:Uncharacterized protein n=1 Tax=Nocardioides bigeumensis TaxID=433657 RepID=A0ABN2XSC7_9ACTN